ncbi:MAG: hypothetical protein DI498_10855 [Paracoccus denitrificans]|nr:MAG: hypothetical protein DI498_10855 [Paracoccus denitrificans]PZO83642.1 MAG: hypothetical protein DI633_10855 [Paracoccus denitrificans]
MRPSLGLALPDPEWVTLLKAERSRGKSVSQIARETGMARPSVSMLISDTYPARSLDLAAAKHGARIVQLYRDQVLCPHLHRGISTDACRQFAATPMSTSNPDKLQHWAACRRCSLNPLTGEEE